MSPKTPRFDWDEANVGHIARHQVEREEVEEAFRDPFQLLIDTYTRMNELRYVMLGETVEGRILRVVFVVRNGRTRAVTAYTAKRRDRIFYEETRREQTL